MQKQSRHQVSLEHKQEALILLGGQKDGSFADIFITGDTKQRWNQVQVAAKYNVSKTTVSKWKRNAVKILSVHTRSRNIKKLYRLKADSFLQIEKGSQVYMRGRVQYMKWESVFRKEAMHKAALDIRDQFVETMEANLSSEASNEEKLQTRDSVNTLLTFKDGLKWLSSFMRRNRLIRSKGAGQNGHFT